MEIVDKMAGDFNHKMIDFDEPFNESFGMLNFDDQQIMHNVIKGLSEDPVMIKLVQDLPKDIKDDIFKAGDAAPHGVVTGSDDEKLLHAFMYYTDADGLADPSCDYMHNYIKKKVQGIFEPPLTESFEMLVEEDQQIMHNVLVTVSKDDDFNKLVVDLPAD